MALFGYGNSYKMKLVSDVIIFWLLILIFGSRCRIFVGWLLTDIGPQLWQWA